MFKLAIMGKANSGKNTLSKMLVNQLRLKNNSTYLSSKYLSFADPIKKIAEEMFPDLPKKYLYGSSKYRNEIIPNAFKNNVPLTVRQLLIDIGTSGREYNPDIWINKLNNNLQKTTRKIIVITDCRFLNEFNCLRQNKFLMIRLYRNSDQPDIQHISELGQKNVADEEFDFILDNNRSLLHLKNEVIKLVDNLVY